MHMTPRPKLRMLRLLVTLSTLVVCAPLSLAHPETASNGPADKFSATRASHAPAELAVSSHSALGSAHERDSMGDGFPDSVRLTRPEDRVTFVRWLGFLAESQFYRPLPATSAEIHDCAGLIRFAFRNALMAHNAAWRMSTQIGPASEAPNVEPDFGDLREFTYPNWALGPNLFRIRAGPLAPGDLGDGAFAQFADAAALLHYNTFLVSRDVRSALAGDLLFYDQPGQSEPYHSMLFVGRSNFQAEGADWVVYHTGDLNGRPGEVRELELQLLMHHPDPRWRPLAANPRFLGVYRFELLR